MKKWLVRILLGVLALVVVVMVAAAFFLGDIVKREIETAGPRVAKVAVSLDTAKVWLWDGRAQLKGLFIGNPPGCKTAAAIQVGDISVRVVLLSALSQKVVIDSIRVNSPEITIEGRLYDNNLTKIQQNVNDYVKSQPEIAASGTPGPGSTPSAARPGRTYQVNDLIIAGAKLQLRSVVPGSESVTIPLPDIHLSHLGATPEGITGSELAQATLAALTRSVEASATDAVGRLGKDILSGGKHVDLKKGAEKLKSLFEK